MDQPPELERLIRERIRELQEANESLRQQVEMQARELETLQQVATQLTTAQGMEALHDQILDTALTIL